MIFKYNSENRGLIWKLVAILFWMIFVLCVMWKNSEEVPKDNIAESLSQGESADESNEIGPSSTTASSEVTPQALQATNVGGSEEYVAICMAVKDQSLDLPEWFVHHYHHLGIRRFYIMDDGSDPPLSDVEDYGIPRKHITFQYFDRTEHRPDMQDHIYNICADTYRQNHTWMAFIDADEYLEMTGGETLNDMLKGFEKDEHIGALGVSWRTHSSNGHNTRPPSCRKAFTDCIGEYGEGGDNQMFKSIARLKNHAGHSNVHMVHLSEGTITVGEHGEELHGAIRLPSTKDRIALHHYAIKSYQEYEEKLNRSNAMDQPKGWNFWDRVEKAGGFECNSMAEYDP